MKTGSSLFLAAAFAASGALAGCGDSPSAPPPAAPGAPPASAPAGAPAAAPASGGGAFDASKATATIRIKATLKGTPPKARPINFSADPVCGDAHKEPMGDETFVCADGKLANVMTWVSKGAEKWTYAPATDPVVLDQKGCMYTPHVFTIQVNQPLTIKNSDPTTHNVHSKPKSRKIEEFNKSQGAGAPDLSTKFAAEEAPLSIKCDVHSWMQTWAGVFSHPFHGVTGADGTHSIKVPAGDFEVSAWHEGCKDATAQKVSVKDGETKEVEFVFEIK